MGRHGAPSASLSSGSLWSSPEAGPVRATRRSDAIPRPRASCPATSAAGMIMTLSHDVHGQSELVRPGVLPSRSLSAKLKRLAPPVRQSNLCASIAWVVGCLRPTGDQQMREESGTAMGRACSAHHADCSCQVLAQQPARSARSPARGLLQSDADAFKCAVVAAKLGCKLGARRRAQRWASLSHALW